MEHSLIVLFSIALDVLGLFLLAREVYIGQQMEELSGGIEETSRLVFLFATQDFRGFYIASRLDQGDSPEDAQKWVDALPPAAIEKAVRSQWADLAPQAVRSIRRWHDRTVPAVMLWRRNRLILGTGLIMIATALHALA